MLLLLPILALLPAALADTVALSQSLVSQAPAVARAGRPYSFTLSPNTFITDSPSLTYAATNLPSWLTFDSSSLCFFGTSPSADAPPRSIRLTATTEDGHSTADTFALAVELPPGLTVLNPLVDQLRAGKAAITSAYPLLPLSTLFPGVRVPGGWSFSVGLLPVFSSPNKRKIIYGATQPNGSALPDWLHFNENTLTFDGIAPSPAQLERRGSDGVFKVRLWGSDIKGYMDEYQDFTVRVAVKTIEQVRPLSLNLTAGYPLTEEIDLISAFRIAGRPLTRADIADITLDTSTYKLSLGEGNSTISGSPPAEYGGRIESLYMTLASVDGDTLNSTLTITYSGSVFTSDKLGPVRVAPGDQLHVPLAPYLSNLSSSWNMSVLSVDPPEASTWLRLSAENKEVVGTIPQSTKLDKLSLRMKATDKSTNANSYATLLFSLGDTKITEVSAVEGGEKHGQSGATIGGIVVGVLLNCILLGVFVWMWRRRQQRKAVGQRGDEAEGYEEDLEKFAAGPIYRPESFMEVPDGNAADDASEDHHAGGAEGGQPVGLVTPGNEKTPGAGEQESRIGKGWHKRTSTVPTTVLMALNLPTGSPIFPGTPASQMTRHTDSPGSIASAASKARRFLANPFSMTKAKAIPTISNPIVHPSFSNAAFQASLAIAVDSRGIVARGGTFEESTTMTASEFTPSGTFTGTQTFGASTVFTGGDYTTSGQDDDEDDDEEEGQETDFDRPTSEYTARYTTTDVTGSEGFEVGRDAGTAVDQGSAAGDSSVVGKRGSGESGAEWKSNKDSDRASWESGAPFVWNTEVGGGVGGESTVEDSEEGQGGESRRGSTQAETTEYGWMGTDEGGPAASEETFDSDPPVQRSDFRPSPKSVIHPSRESSYGSAASTSTDQRTSINYGSSIRGAVRHEVVTPTHEAELDAADFSIDNIHFPTESDIARTEASSDPSESFDPSTAVIATASRISARHTLDSPMSHDGSQYDLDGSPNSDYTERMPHSPMGPIPSRLVNLADQRKAVVVRPLSAGRREESQTAVLDTDSDTGRVSYYEYPEDDDHLDSDANTHVHTHGAVPHTLQSPAQLHTRGRYEDQSSPLSGESGETTPQARPRRVSVIRASAGYPDVPPLPSGASASASAYSIRSIATTGSKKGKHRARNSSVSSSLYQQALARSRSPTPPMPDSFPSLPALPTGRSLASVKSARSVILPPGSNRTSTSSTASSRLPVQTRVLLGVNEPFHFYPPLLLPSSPSAGSATTAYTLNTSYTSADGKPLTPPGAVYTVHEEQRGQAGEVLGLGEMPEWLHWEDMELWGVPGEDVRGRWDVRIVETREGRERTVGRFALEVVGR